MPGPPRSSSWRSLRDRKSTRLNSSHVESSYAVFCLKKKIGKRKVVDVTRQDIGKLHHSLREAPYQSNRVFAVLSKMFNLAERCGLRPDASNPCRQVEKFSERKRERMLSPAELARLGDTLTRFGGSPYAVAAVKLLVFFFF